VKVRYVWPPCVYKFLDLAATILCPEGLNREKRLLEQAIVNDIVIVARVGDYVVSGPQQHVPFSLKDGVFPA
jgi:hypothetical protein